MKLNFIFLFSLLVSFASMPLGAHAAGTTFPSQIFPQICNCPGSAPAWGCIMQTLQNLMSFVVAFAAVLITIFLALAGFTYMTSGGNPGKHELANKRIMNAVIGLVIVLAAYLLVDSLLKVIYNPANPAFGPWNSILGGTPGEDCLSIVNPPNTPPSVSNPSAGAVGAGSPTISAGISAAVCNAAKAYRGTNTSSGPAGGALACAWAVNNVLTNTGLSPIGGNSVSGMESALKNGRGTSVTQANAVCGDIVVQAGDGHVGICLNTGCTQVISNSSSKASFSWPSGPDFAPTYTGGIGRFYQINN